MNTHDKSNFVIKNNYHDGHLISASIGPRRECTLNIRLNEAWNPGAINPVAIRFGAIENLNEVNEFFSKIKTKPHECRFADQILALICNAKNSILIHFDKSGQLLISCKKINESNHTHSR